jgi:hypothetical protein
MLSVGVAIKLGYRPTEVMGWPLEELALVAAYCELESDGLKKPTASASTPSAPGTRVVTTSVERVVVGKSKGT